MRHYARIKNTSQRCLVIFRQMPTEDGRGVSDPNSCLVAILDTLPDHIRQELERIVNSPSAQGTPDLWECFQRERFRFSNQQVMQYFNPNDRRAAWMPVDNIVMTPANNVEIDLWKVNVANYWMARGINDEESINMKIAEEEQRRITAAQNPQQPAASPVQALQTPTTPAGYAMQAAPQPQYATPPQGAAPQAPVNPQGAYPPMQAQQAPQAPQPPAPPVVQGGIQAQGNHILQDHEIAANYRAEAASLQKAANEALGKANELDPQGGTPAAAPSNVQITQAATSQAPHTMTPTQPFGGGQYPAQELNVVTQAQSDNSALAELAGLAHAQPQAPVTVTTS